MKIGMYPSLQGMSLKGPTIQIGQLAQPNKLASGLSMDEELELARLLYHGEGFVRRVVKEFGDDAPVVQRVPAQRRVSDRGEHSDVSEMVLSGSSGGGGGRRARRLQRNPHYRRLVALGLSRKEAAYATPKIDELLRFCPGIDLEKLYSAIERLAACIDNTCYFTRIEGFHDVEDVCQRIMNFQRAPEPQAQRFFREAGPEVLYTTNTIQNFMKPFDPAEWQGAPSEVMSMFESSLFNSISELVKSRATAESINLYIGAVEHYTQPILDQIRDWPMLVNVQTVVLEILFALAFLNVVLGGDINEPFVEYDNLIQTIDSIGFKPIQKLYLLLSLFTLGGDNIRVISEGMKKYPEFLSETLGKIILQAEELKIVEARLRSSGTVSSRNLSTHERQVVDRLLQNIREHDVNWADDPEAPTLHEFMDDSVINVLFYEMLAINGDARRRISEDE